MPRLSKIGAAALAALGWTSGSSGVTASYLVVAGGAGGGYGGGGAGGLLTGTTTLTLASSYTVIVGSGGTGSSVSSGVLSGGTNGANSQFGAFSAIGGGLGGGAGQVGFSGGSGGGAGSTYGTNISGGSGTSGQGNAGGNGVNGAVDYVTGGGGGAGAAGGNSSGNTSGSGGNGTASSISGTSVTYAGGGGGGARSPQGTSSGSGGTGGGGAGSATGNGSNGTVSLGSGGGGACITGGGNPTTSLAGNGGSGVVIISYAGAQQFGGGIVTSVGGNTIHTFNTSGTLSPLNSLTASYLIVAGGGSGGQDRAGGGGAGGMLTDSGLTIDTNSTYLVTVGAGGAGGGVQNNGTDSVFSLVTNAVGGGKGSAGGSTAGNGGSGGGSATGVSPGTGTAGQGNSGGTSPSGTGNGMGGGGGAGAAGGNATSTTGGNGGAGLSSSISGTATYYAGGGGGGKDGSGAGGNGTAGTGGIGGGGNGQAGNGAVATAGTANTGGGGGGGGGVYGVSGGTGASGGSGIVIISYAGSTQQMAGGTVTIVGGNVIHTFTSSGYLTPLTYVGNSLRFRSSNSAYLSRTPTVTSNQTTWTWSAWVKRGQFGAYQGLFNSFTDTSNYSVLDFTSSDQIRIINNYAGGGEQGIITNAVYRDPAAWYHIVVACSASSVPKLYVNGVQVTSFASSSAVTGNWLYNTAGKLIKIGYENYTGSYNFYFDGYMANVQFIDGQALAPTAFGTFNSYGVWQPINYGGSYGTNGFYLPFNQGSSTYAGSFNGSNQSLQLPNSASGLNFGTGDWTIEFWMKTSSTADQNVIEIANDGTYGTLSFEINYPSTGTATIYCSTSGSSWTTRLNGVGSFPVNTWSHVALVRYGNTFTFYQNGISAGSGSMTGTAYTGTYSYIGANYYSGSLTAYFNGNISNVRIVKGTAVYTSNFIPSTKPLTAISGTQLLTLQNATIVDNSTNAYTITNNNSVTTATNSNVFVNTTVLTADQGPAGNNWTPNNISTTIGSTYDSMTDAPTLTSATAANYATLNPIATFVNAGAVPLPSDGNLTMNFTSTSNWQRTVGTMAIPTTGKYYWEITISQMVSGSGGLNCAWGLADASTLYPVPDGGSAGWIQFWINNTVAQYVLGARATTTNYGSVPSSGDVLMVAVDRDNNKIWWGLNGTWFSSGNPAIGTNPAGTGNMVASTNYLQSITSYGYSGTQTPMNCQINNGQQPFKYTPPSGFVALNTYNL